MKIVLEYNVIYISIISSFLIILLLLVRGFFGTKIHKVFFTLAWTFILMRLVLPIGMVIPAERPEWIMKIHGSLKEVSFSWFAWIWFAGACITGIVFIVRYVMCGRMLREALPIQKVPDIDEEMFTFMGIRVYVSDRISSPITFGIFQQKVLLPRYYMNLTREQLKFILIHEKIHIDCHDNLHKFFIILAVCIHWFNPFAWLMYVCSNRDIELACDEKVIRQVGEVDREGYANVLISLASEEVVGKAVYSGFAGSAIKKRIMMIMGYRNMRKWNYLLYAAALIVLIPAFAIPGHAEDNGGAASAQEQLHPSGGDSADLLKDKVYDAVPIEHVLKLDDFGARAYVSALTKEGVELNFKLLLNKEVAVTNSAILTLYLPDGKEWEAGLDDTYDGVVTIPEAVIFRGKQYPVTKISSYTFYNCKNLKEVRMPDTIKEIETKAFYHCESMKRIKLPVSLETMGVNPFIGCISLEAFEMPESRTQYQVKDGVLYTDFGRYLKVFPQGKKQDHITLDRDVLQIATLAFYGSEIQSVMLPKAMVRVKSRSFQNCKSLLEVTAGQNTRFAADAFEGARQAHVVRMQ